jgi:hypothetical protein
MKIIYTVLLTLIFLPVTLSAQLEAVVLNDAYFNKKTKKVSLRKYPSVQLEKKYSIKCHYYYPDRKWLEKLLAAGNGKNFIQWNREYPEYRSFRSEKFLEDLETAKLLYLGQYNQTSSAVINAYSKHIKKFLARGGVLFIDYSNNLPDFTDFFETIGVKNPVPEYKDYKTNSKNEYYKTEPNPKCKLSLLNRPWKLDKIRSYGWWNVWSDKQIIPFQNSAHPEKSAAMIIQENVMGQGKVIFNSISGIFRSSLDGGNTKYLENTLSYIFDKNIKEYLKQQMEARGGPGEIADLREVSK